MNTDNAPYAHTTFITLSAAELGAVKSVVDSLPFTRNRTEQKKLTSTIVRMLVQLQRAKKPSLPMSYAKLLSFSTKYSIEEDDLFYTFEVESLLMRPKSAE